MAAVTASPARAAEALSTIEPAASQTLLQLTRLFKAIVLQPDNLMNVNNLSTSVSPTVFPSISLRDAVSEVIRCRCCPSSSHTQQPQGTLMSFLVNRCEAIWGGGDLQPGSSLRHF